ncbi:synaptonemal complex protein 1 isoform X2 [Takifugu flavidus]|nr:synaptonemal complex protein 1 isoform X2 [Takifugu flavidus]XP_056885466.1 synaptonemal complex protein 1 isoform X2 [Takifugu flavidus]
MEKERGFNFQLLIPSKVNNCQAVRPQENLENCSGFINTLQKGFSNFNSKEQTKSTKPGFPKIKVMPPLEKEERKYNSVQLFSKLFDEVEKIRCWKVQTNSDNVEKERRLHQNGRTIESLQRTIQELQFCNESLSMKMQEHLDDIENLRNKNNVTKNLCNTLNDTFQRTAEKIQLFESEREETHHLFVENIENIQKMIAEFEILRFQAEADQQEMQKVKEKMLQFEDLQEKYHYEYNVKEEEVAVLQTKLKDKENELQNILLEFSESQKCCRQLQETTNEQHELLKKSQAEQDSLLQELHNAKQCCEETQKNCDAIGALLEQNKEECAINIQNKDSKLEELSRVQQQQAQKLEQSQIKIQELQNALTLETERVKELKDDLSANVKDLERSNTLLEEAAEQSAKKSLELKLLQDDLEKKYKCIDSMKVKIDLSEARVKEMTAELLKKNEESLQLKSEFEVATAANNMLKDAHDAAEKAKEDLMKKSKDSENTVQELEGYLSTEKQNNRENTIQIEQLKKELIHHEMRYEELLVKFNELQSEKTAIQQKFEFGISSVKAMKADMKLSEAKAMKQTREIQELESENQHLRNEVNSIKLQIQRKREQTETFEKKIEDNFAHLQGEITQKEKRIKVLEKKLFNLRKNSNKALENQKEISVQQEEHKQLQKPHEEETQRLLNDIESESALASELTDEVGKDKLTAVDVIKNKEETELKCQQKIADMVALMEKHKGHYEQIVGEKDAELVMRKKKETEALAHYKSLELELMSVKTDISQLKLELKTEVTKKQNVLEELSAMKKGMSSMKTSLPSDVVNKESPDLSSNAGVCAKTPKEFSKAQKAPSSKKDHRAEVQKKTKCESEITKTLHGAVPRPKAYRIKTPPSAPNAHWKMATMDLDFKSDSSDQSDILNFAGTPPAPALKSNILPKVRNPARQKSPENKLKFASMKRMRDAGWTAVTGCDHKKKKNNEKIFA